MQTQLHTTPLTKHQSVSTLKPAIKLWIINRIFGGSHWCTKWVVELCRADPQLLNHITEQSPDYVHMICIIRLAILKQPTENNVSAWFYARLFQEINRKKLLDNYYNPYPKGLLSVLKKLGPKPLSKKDYNRLIYLLHDKNASKFLCHAKRIYSYNLHWLELMPCEFRCSQIMKCIKTTDDYNNFNYIAKVIQVMSHDLSHNEIMNSLKNIKNTDQLKHWFDRLLLKIIYPTPPWRGNSWIKPVTTAKELHKLRMKFKNCIYDYSGDILLGNKYIYVSDRGPSLISINKDPMIGWHIEQMKSIGNSELPSQLKRKIIDVFSKIGIEQCASMSDLFFGIDDWE